MSHYRVVDYESICSKNKRSFSTRKKKLIRDGWLPLENLSSQSPNSGIPYFQEFIRYLPGVEIRVEETTIPEKS